MSNSPNRSYESIEVSDLQRLRMLAEGDLSALANRCQHLMPFIAGPHLLCLCQGAAQHFIYGDRGVQDFDVWAFFPKQPAIRFPHRRRGKIDFGPSRFGRNPEDGPSFAGRRVDVIGRDIEVASDESLGDALVRYLSETRTASAWHLSKRPVVELASGRVLWDKVQD